MPGPVTRAVGVAQVVSDLRRADERMDVVSAGYFLTRSRFGFCGAWQWVQVTQVRSVPQALAIAASRVLGQSEAITGVELEDGVIRPSHGVVVCVDGELVITRLGPEFLPCSDRRVDLDPKTLRPRRGADVAPDDREHRAIESRCDVWVRRDVLPVSARGAQVELLDPANFQNVDLARTVRTYGPDVLKGRVHDGRVHDLLELDDVTVAELGGRGPNGPRNPRRHGGCGPDRAVDRGSHKRREGCGLCGFNLCPGVYACVLPFLGHQVTGSGSSARATVASGIHLDGGMMCIATPSLSTSRTSKRYVAPAVIAAVSAARTSTVAVPSAGVSPIVAS